METEKVFMYRKHDLRMAKGKLIYILRQGDARPRSDSEALGTSWHFVATRCTDGKHRRQCCWSRRNTFRLAPMPEGCARVCA